MAWSRATGPVTGSPPSFAHRALSNARLLEPRGDQVGADAEPLGDHQQGEIGIVLGDRDGTTALCLDALLAQIAELLHRFVEREVVAHRRRLARLGSISLSAAMRRRV